MIQQRLFTAPVTPRRSGLTPEHTLWIGVNPSVAGYQTEDHTSRKFIGFTSRWSGIDDGADSIISRAALFSPCGSTGTA